VTVSDATSSITKVKNTDVKLAIAISIMELFIYGLSNQHARPRTTTKYKLVQRSVVA
jgi:hypothetical protein